MLSIITFKHEQVFNLKLVAFGPPDFQSFLNSARRLLLDFGCVQEVKYLLVIDLQEAAGDGDVLRLPRFFGLVEGLFNGSNGQPIIKIVCLNVNLAGPGIRIVQFGCLIIFVTLHGIRLSRASLAICEYGSVKAIDHLGYKTWCLQ